MIALSMSPDGAELGIGEHAADRLDAGDLAHEPAREIEVVDAHVDDQAAAGLRDWRTRPTAGTDRATST